MAPLTPRPSVPAFLACAALLAASTPLVTGCRKEDNSLISTNSAPAARVVGVATVTQGVVTRTLTQPATMQGIQEAVLYAKTSGYLKTLYVDKGDRVKAGQLLAVIESPELGQQQQQARAGYEQARASSHGIVASMGRAEAEAAHAAAGVQRAQADVAQEVALINRAKADQAQIEAQIPKLQALVEAADADAQQASEEESSARSEIGRRQQQLKAAQASIRAFEAGLTTAQANARLQQTTYNRHKAIQDKDPGLIPAQQVDEARTRMEASQAEVEAARSRLEAARQDVGTAEQQVEGARRSAAAAAQKVNAVKSHARAAREDLQLGQRDIETARQQVKVAEAKHDAARSLVTVAEAQRRVMGQQVRVVKAGIAASRQQVQGSKSAMQTSASLAGYARIIAPFDGIVTERLVDPGAFVQNAGSNQASAQGIVKLVNDRSLRVLIPTPEGDIPHIRKGRAASISVDAYPTQTFLGAVSRFASAVDPKSRTMLTEVDIPNKDGRLRPGMYARVTLTLETRRDALTVPSAAVMGKDERFVYLVEGGTARKTPVVVGTDDGKMAEITAGLKPGAVVVITGRDNLVDGAPVQAEPAE